MSEAYRELIYTGEDIKDNWLYNRYYYGGGNARYYTFQIALNLLRQRTPNPVIIETGCQRQEEDVGAGMSTSLFAEYISRYGGELISVDLVLEHLVRAATYVKKWPEAKVKFAHSDSLLFLREYRSHCDLVYLDSLDYPIGAEAGDVQKQKAAQEHCLNELIAIWPALNSQSIVLLDDNQLPGGGKPALAKQYLVDHHWHCVLDLQSSLWINKG